MKFCRIVPNFPPEGSSVFYYHHQCCISHLVKHEMFFLHTLYFSRLELTVSALRSTWIFFHISIPIFSENNSLFLLYFWRFHIFSSFYFFFYFTPVFFFCFYFVNLIQYINLFPYYFWILKQESFPHSEVIEKFTHVFLWYYFLFKISDTFRIYPSVWCGRWVPFYLFQYGHPVSPYQLSSSLPPLIWNTTFIVYLNSIYNSAF